MCSNAPLQALPQAIDGRDRNRLTKAISNATAQQLLPAIRVLHDYLQREYLPRARTGLALSELPLGPRWYAYRVKLATSLDLPPEEIHRIGVAEVERLGIPAQAPAKRRPARRAAPLNCERLPGAGREGARRAARSFFRSPPDRIWKFCPTQWPLEPARGAVLPTGRAGGNSPRRAVCRDARGTGHGVSVAGFLSRRCPVITIKLHFNRGGRPARFRRFGSEAAFTEGWGMYAASLGEALGLYPDEAAKSTSPRQRGVARSARLSTRVCTPRAGREPGT